MINLLGNYGHKYQGYARGNTVNYAYNNISVYLYLSMERLYMLVKDYSTKWKHVMKKAEFDEKYGELPGAGVCAHNFTVLQNHHLLMDLIQRLNNVDLENPTDDDNAFMNEAIELTDGLDEKDFIAIN